MGCTTSLIKIIIFIFNFIFALGGLALLIVGILILKDVQDVDEFLDGKYQAPPILLIVVGSIIFLVSFCGFCGAIRKSPCMLYTYVALLITLFVAQVVIAGLAFAFRDDTNDILRDKLTTYVKNYNEHKAVVDSIQNNHKCCGAKGATDYGHLPTSPLPPSCCVEGNTCRYMAPSSSYYPTGCEEALKDFIRKQGNILGGVAIGIASIEILGIIFGLCLANSIKKENRRAVV